MKNDTIFGIIVGIIATIVMIEIICVICEGMEDSVTKKVTKTLIERMELRE